MNAPSDLAARERFVTELGKNFSVIAAAGSGKTRAITDRIVRIAQDRHAREWLPQLVVVAFTNRAADEMQQRTRAEILRAGVSFDLLPAFNRAFFGTIHSFCVRLLETYGHYLGLPPALELITDDEDVWNAFVQRQTSVGRSLSAENRRELLRHVQVRQLMELGRRADLSVVDPPFEKCPDANFSAVYKFKAKGAAMQTIPRLQEELRRAEQVWRESDDFVRWPACTSRAQEFVPIWREARAPLRRWIDQCSLCVAAEVQRDYRELRIERGMLTYDDQIALALQLLDNPEAARQIREENYRVVLDEAQDTDPRQFSLLLEITRPPDASSRWPEDRSANGRIRRGEQSPPRAGHFCMVGDFQQSIYRNHADLLQYRRIHNTLVKTGAAEALKFSVTFRLDTAQLEIINASFRAILNDSDNQVAFVELNPRPQILPGQVVRLNLDSGNLAPDARGKISDARKAGEEARQLSKWLRTTGLSELRANSWSDVAILCPRKEWLQTLRRGLRDESFSVQIQSEKELKGDSPAYAWLTALIAIMTAPRDGYEIVGVLREMFGISDHDLALFSLGDGDRFQIENRTEGNDSVAKALNLLTETRLSILELPLFDAVSEMIDRTQLRERLGSLPPEDFENLDGELGALLALAAASEAEAMTLSEFSEALRTHFADPRDIRASAADSIQLITGQKAKGSEWQAVVVPFLSREVRSASPRYPRVLRDADTGEVTLLLDKSEVTFDIEAALKREERQEMERLLYVALTRAKHTLVLACDHELFAKASGEVHSASQIKWLQAGKGEQNESVFESISGGANACSQTAARQAENRQAEKIDKLPIAGKIDIEVARQNASMFARNLNPSGLPPEEISNTRPTGEIMRPAAASGPALRYGVWWHEFVQQLSWNAPPSAWDKIFAAGNELSPNRARSLREWQMLREHLTSESDFRRRIAAKIVYQEMPLFWKIDQSKCLEGIVDLALLAPNEEKVFIVDWKTNRIAQDQLERLRAQYRPQMAAYWKAVTQLTKARVEAAIYSTSTGQLAIYENDELVTEWNRLLELPPEQLAVVTNDEPRTSAQLEFANFS